MALVLLVVFIYIEIFNYSLVYHAAQAAIASK